MSKDLLVRLAIDWRLGTSLVKVPTLICNLLFMSGSQLCLNICTSDVVYAQQLLSVLLEFWYLPDGGSYVTGPNKTLGTLADASQLSQLGNQGIKCVLCEPA